MTTTTEVFIGAMGDRAFFAESIRNAFREAYFDLCAVHHLPGFDRRTFATWVQDLHCKKGVDTSLRRRAQFYCVNYFMCPEGDEFDVEAAMREVFPETSPQPLSDTPEYRTVLSLGRYRVIKLSNTKRKPKRSFESTRS